MPPYPPPYAPSSLIAGFFMPSIDFHALHRTVNLLDVLRLVGWEPWGREWTSLRGWCPLHSNHPHKSRSFSVNAGGQWYCWSCRRGGDLVEFWRAHTGLDTYSAVVNLCALLRVRVPYLPRSRTSQKPAIREEGA